MTLPLPGESYSRDGKERRVVQVDERYVVWDRGARRYWSPHDVWAEWTKGAIQV